MPLNVSALHEIPLAPPLYLPLKLRLPQGRFGAKRSSPSPARFHTGVDLHAAIGSLVFPVYGGRVVDARGLSEGREAGDGIVRVFHQPSGTGYISTYIHLQEVLVTLGDWVEVGDQLGKVGVPASKSWEPHLHFELRHIIAEDLSGLSTTDLNKSLTRLSRTMAIDPTRLLYHWELENYQNANGVDREVTPRAQVSQIAEMISQHIRYFRVRLSGVDGNFHVPLYKPLPDELSLVETIRSAYLSKQAVIITWRRSDFFENKQLITEVRV